MSSEAQDTRLARMDGRGRKKCVHCNRKSIAGLSTGLCPYHWAVAVYGAIWADKCYLPEGKKDVG